MKFKDRRAVVEFVCWTFVVPFAMSAYLFANLFGGWHIPKPNELQSYEGIITVKEITVKKMIR